MTLSLRFVWLVRGSARFSRALSLSLALGLPAIPRASAETADASVLSAADQSRRAQVLVRGDGFSITVGTLEDHINKQPPGLRARYAESDERKALLDSLVRLELLGREAAARGMAASSSVRQTVKDGAVQTLVRNEVDAKVTSESISQEDIAAFYNAHPEEFHHAAQRRASHIALATRAEAQALLSEAAKADMRGFAELARKHSLDTETKLRGGDLAFFALEPARDASLRQVPEALRKAVFALKAPGDTGSEPVQVDAQFSLIRFTGERPERHVTLAEAEGSIRARLWRERRQEAVSDLINTLRARQKPQVFAERVDLVKFDDMDKRPSGFMPDPPASRDAGNKAKPK
jgi:parvulin-like peptidyl-prolyl isomerase